MRILQSCQTLLTCLCSVKQNTGSTSDIVVISDSATITRNPTLTRAGIMPQPRWCVPG